MGCVAPGGKMMMMMMMTIMMLGWCLSHQGWWWWSSERKAGKKDNRNIHRVCWQILKQRNHLENLSLDGNIKINLENRRSGSMTWIHLAQSTEQWRVLDCFEYGNEHSVYIRCREHLQWLRSYKPLNKGNSSTKIAKFSYHRVIALKLTNN